MLPEQEKRRSLYDDLHRTDELRFPKEDYAPFFNWLNVPGDGEGLKLLDIACGQGFLLEQAERLSPKMELHGLDFSKTALEIAQRRLAHTELRQGSAYEMDYPDESFDYCVNLGSLEHFEAPEAALGEMHRVLRRTGKAMVIVPNTYYLGTVWRAMAYGEGDDQGQEGMIAVRTVEEWRSLFLESSLDVTGLQGYNGVDHIAWWFKRKDGEITEDERHWRVFLDTFVKPMIPLNLSHCFVFFLRRQV